MIKQKKLQFLCLIKDVDPFLFEFLTDSIEYPNKKLAFNKERSFKVFSIKNNIVLSFIYCNTFSTKRLNTCSNYKKKKL